MSLVELSKLHGATFPILETFNAKLADSLGQPKHPSWDEMMIWYSD